MLTAVTAGDLTGNRIDDKMNKSKKFTTEFTNKWREKYLEKNIYLPN